MNSYQQSIISNQWKENCFNEILENFGQNTFQTQGAAQNNQQNQQEIANLIEFCDQEINQYQQQQQSTGNLTFEQMINMYEKETSSEVMVSQNNNSKFEIQQEESQEIFYLQGMELQQQQLQQQQQVKLQQQQQYDQLSNSTQENTNSLRSSMHMMNSCQSNVLSSTNSQQQQQQQQQQNNNNYCVNNEAQDLKNQLNMIRMNFSADPSAPLKPTNDIQFSRVRMISEKQKAQIAKKQAQQLLKMGSKSYQQTNTSHITFNMVNQLFPYLIKIYQTKVACRCTLEQQLLKTAYLLENQMDLNETLVQDAHQCCKRCFELQELVQIKNSGKKTKKTFQQIWSSSRRIQILSEDFFLHRGAASILNHKQYRNTEGKLALYESLPKFIDAVRSQSFKKLIG